MFQSTLSTNMVLQGKFRCKIEGCSAVFDNSALKLQHISENHRKSLQDQGNNVVMTNDLPEKLFMCKMNNCNLAFESAQSRLRHQNLTHHSNRVRCPVKSCNIMLKSRCLRPHIKSVHQKIRASCGKCGKKFHFSYIRLHEARCTMEVSTPKVTKRASVSNQQNKHSSHNQGKYACGYKNCNKVFSTSRGRMNHFSWSHSKNVLCTFKNCNVRLPPAKLTRHIKNVHKHNKMENSQGPVPCKVQACKMSFESSSKRDTHMKNFHTNVVKCPQPRCGIMLARTSLSRHMKNKHDKKQIKCNFCGVILTKYSFYHHQKQCQNKFNRFKHSIKSSKVQKSFFKREKPLKCPVQNCSAIFSTIKSQKSHLYDRHHDPIPCPHQGCHVILKPGFLKTHVKSVHGQKDPVSFYLEENTSSRLNGDVGSPGPKPKVKQEVTLTNHDVTLAKAETVEVIPNINNVRPNSWKRLPTVSCGMGCDEKFFKESTRLYHVSKHHKTPMKCPFEGCTLVAAPSQIIRHQQYNHSDQPKQNIKERERRRKILESKLNSLKRMIRCTQASCGARFTTESKRDEHIKIHHRTYIPCPFEECDFTAEPENLVNHMKSGHSTTETELKETVPESLDDSTAKRKRLMCLVRGCVAVFSNENSRIKHTNTQHSGQVLCPFPDCKVPLPGGILGIHIKVTHAELKSELSENELLVSQEKLFPAKKTVAEEPIVKEVAKEDSVVNETIEEKPFDSKIIKKEPTLKKVVKTKPKVVKKAQMSKLRPQEVFDLPWMYKFMEQDKQDNQVKQGIIYKCIAANCPKQFATPARQSYHIYSLHQKIIVCPHKGCNHTAKLGSMSQHYWYTHNPLNKSFDNLRDKRNLTKVSRGNYEKNDLHNLSNSDDSKKTIKQEIFKGEKKGRSYKCSYEGCAVNFETAGLRAEHEKLHQTLVLCPNNECKDLVPALELNEHIDIAHRNFKDRCYYCKKTFDWAKITAHIRSCQEKYA